MYDRMLAEFIRFGETAISVALIVVPAVLALE
jgi:hypothetical protein